MFSGADGSSTNLAVAGSTLNDEAYGPVPVNFLGIPQSDDVSRIAELVDRIKTDKPQALLLSGGGNDVAGDEFFSFIENARSGFVNPDVLQGVLNRTFKSAFEYIIDNALSAAGDRTMPIFIHGYDYPWPDGRGAEDCSIPASGPAAAAVPKSCLPAASRRAIAPRGQPFSLFSRAVFPVTGLQNVVADLQRLTAVRR